MISIVNGMADRAKLISASVGVLWDSSDASRVGFLPPAIFLSRLSVRSLFLSRTFARRARLADDSSSDGWLLGLQPSGDFLNRR